MLAIGVAKMKTLTINGVPYSVNEKQELFLYSSTPPIRIGSYDTASQKISIDSDWKTKSQAFLTQYRTSLAQSTAAALEKAAALQNS
jgi:hypothetical protein